MISLETLKDKTILPIAATSVGLAAISFGLFKCDGSEAQGREPLQNAAEVSGSQSPDTFAAESFEPPSTDQEAQSGSEESSELEGFFEIEVRGKIQKFPEAVSFHSDDFEAEMHALLMRAQLEDITLEKRLELLGLKSKWPDNYKSVEDPSIFRPVGSTEKWNSLLENSRMRLEKIDRLLEDFVNEYGDGPHVLAALNLMISRLEGHSDIRASQEWSPKEQEDPEKTIRGFYLKPSQVRRESYSSNQQEFAAVVLAPQIDEDVIAVRAWSARQRIHELAGEDLARVLELIFDHGPEIRMLFNANKLSDADLLARIVDSSLPIPPS